jgi:hypothetical protein
MKRVPLIIYAVAFFANLLVGEEQVEIYQTSALFNDGLEVYTSVLLHVV